jgi:hypothetical protein
VRQGQHVQVNHSSQSQVNRQVGPKQCFECKIKTRKNLYYPSSRLKMNFPWYRKNQDEARRRKSVEQGLKDILGNVFVSQDGSAERNEGDNYEGKGHYLLYM